MFYEKERKMVPHIIEGLKNVFSINKKIAIAEELTVSSRIIDLVFLTIENEDLLDEEIINKLKRLNSSEQYILSLMSEYGDFSIQKIASDTFSDYYNIKNDYIKLFLNLNFIEQLSRYRFKVIEPLINSIGELYAVEAKLSRWKEAIAQAEDTKKFADYSYVAMDAEFANEKKNAIISHFTEKNIGLILVDEDGSLSTAVNTKKVNSKNKTESRLQQLKALQDFNTNKKWKVLN